MTTRRKEIRKAIQALLIDKTDAGANVFSNLSSSLWSEDLPQIAIYTRSENIEAMNVAPREYKRYVEIAIEIVAEGPEDPNSDDGKYLEDILDDIAEQVETEMNRDETIGTYTDAFGNSCVLVDELILNNVEFEFRGEGSKPTGSARLIFNALYHDYRPADQSQQGINDNLETVVADWKVGHNDSEPDDVIEASDEIDIPD